MMGALFWRHVRNNAAGVTEYTSRDEASPDIVVQQQYRSTLQCDSVSLQTGQTRDESILIILCY